MNILQIVSVARTGGVERHVVVLSDLLRQRGHRVTALCPPGEWLPAQLREVGVPVLETTMHGPASLAVIRDLPRLVREHNFDLIHSHLTRATYFAFAAGQITRRPAVSSVHVFTHDLVYRRLFPKPGNQIITVSESLRASLLRQGIPENRVRTIHNGTNFYPPDLLPAPFPDRVVESRVAQEVAVGETVSLVRGGATHRLAEKDETEVYAESLPESVSSDFETFRKQQRPRPEALTVHSEWSVPQDAELIGLFARMEEFKGPIVLTHAVRKILAARPRAYFFFVGPIEADMQQALWEIANRDGVVDRLRFTGGRDDVARLMSAMDVVTLPSRFEACSMAIIEAMMLGKPVVATRAGGNPELIQEGETGLLIERNPEALADAIIHLLSNTALRLEMGAAARLRALSRFSANVMVNHIEALYEELVASSPFR